MLIAYSSLGDRHGGCGQQRPSLPHLSPTATADFHPQTNLNKPLYQAVSLG